MKTVLRVNHRTILIAKGSFLYCPQLCNLPSQTTTSNNRQHRNLALLCYISFLSGFVETHKTALSVFYPVASTFRRSLPPAGGIGVRGIRPCKRREDIFPRCLHDLSLLLERLILLSGSHRLPLLCAAIAVSLDTACTDSALDEQYSAKASVSSRSGALRCPVGA